MAAGGSKRTWSCPACVLTICAMLIQAVLDPAAEDGARVWLRCKVQVWVPIAVITNAEVSRWQCLSAGLVNISGGTPPCDDVGR